MESESQQEYRPLHLRRLRKVLGGSRAVQLGIDRVRCLGENIAVVAAFEANIAVEAAFEFEAAAVEVDAVEAAAVEAAVEAAAADAAAGPLKS